MVETSQTVDTPHADFCIEIDYEKNSPNPSRVFRAASDLIDALQSLDTTLLEPIDLKLEPILLLEDIEAGSVKVWIAQKVKTVLESVDDDVLGSGDYKKVIASYLVKAKSAAVRFLENKTEITSAADIEPLEREIFQLGEDAYLSQLLPHHQTVSRKRLLNDVNKINSALAPLTSDDKVNFIDREGNSASFNLSLSIAPETIAEILTREVITSPPLVMILKIKKPDFLGDSQWEFRFDNSPFFARIVDEEWLTTYRNGDEPLVPGDALKGIVETTVKYGFEGEVIEQHHIMLKVIEVIRPPRPNQTSLNLG
jgi:hypothetical protein